MFLGAHRFPILVCLCFCFQVFGAPHFSGRWEISGREKVFVAPAAFLLLVSFPTVFSFGDPHFSYYVLWPVFVSRKIVMGGRFLVERKVFLAPAVFLLIGPPLFHKIFGAPHFS